MAPEVFPHQCQCDLKPNPKKIIAYERSVVQKRCLVVYIRLQGGKQEYLDTISSIIFLSIAQHPFGQGLQVDLNKLDIDS
jgi:hypothetical protein